MRTSMLVVALVAMLPLSAYAGEDELYGTYTLVSRSQKVLDTGQVDTYAKERGFITYGKDGRMFVIIVDGNRPKPESLAKMTDQQRAELFRSMSAYSGTYKFDGKAVEHHIDMSWNEVWTGTTQIRDVKKEGDKVILTTRPAPRPQDGKMAVTTLVWEKAK